MRRASNGKVRKKMLANGKAESYLCTECNCANMSTLWLPCQSPSWDCCLGWEWQTAAVQVPSANWIVCEGLVSHLCYWGWLGGVWWSGRSKVCSNFGAENSGPERAGGDTCSSSSGGISRPAALRYPRGVHRPPLPEPGVCTSETNKYVAWRAHIQAANRREITEYCES